MNVPAEISFRNMQKTGPLDALVREKIAKLEEFCDHISRCSVIVEQQERKQRSANPYHVRIDLTIPPGHHIAVNQKPRQVDVDDAADAEIRSAFKKAGRLVRELNERQHGNAAEHEQHSTNAVIETLFREQGYGFIRTIDNRQVYFHRNALDEKDYDRLQPGTGVSFDETRGKEGPQARHVRIIEKPGVGIHHSEKRR
ncbi:MAG: HPF/RaiA family ribosome-associated protein [Chitinivibrionales bacterium]|nr:HPF/RaiA family ribosome-associated protein [Chitinivibrionales bacterium]